LCILLIERGGLEFVFYEIQIHYKHGFYVGVLIFQNNKLVTLDNLVWKDELETFLHLERTIMQH
jgi:hypothetical protein